MPNTKRPPAKEALAALLIDLLRKKPFQKISVNELCEAAGISRSAFYANFEDKYQLLAYCLNELTAELDRLMAKHPPQEFLTVMLDFIQSEDRLFYNIFGYRTNDEFTEILYRASYQHFAKLLRESADRGAELPGPIEAVAPFYIGGLLTMILRWIKSDYQMPKEELAACQYRLLEKYIAP